MLEKENKRDHLCDFEGVKDFLIDALKSTDI